jgi:uncharacterized protein (TIGR02145 family)
MQAAASVEKISGGDFEGGLPGTLASGDETSTWALNATDPIGGTQDGLLEVTSAGTNSLRPLITIGSVRTVGKWYKLSFNYKVNSGTCVLSRIYSGTSVIVNATLSGSGMFEYYYKATGNVQNLYFNGTNTFSVQLDNISDVELGWEDATTLYTWLTTTGGYSEANALKEVGWWAHYSSDTAKGAIFGKAYNGYALDLLDADIDAYNTANPTAEWGYHLPTQAEQETLQDYLGADSGDDLKADSLWTDGTGTNSSGFTALPGGYRDSDGTFRGINEFTILGAVDDDIDKRIGRYIRLIKD